MPPWTMPNRPPGGPSLVPEPMPPSQPRRQRRGLTGTIIMSVASGGPTHGPLHRVAGLLLRRRVRSAVIQRHRDVGSQLQLHLHRVLGVEPYLAAVNGRAELHALLRDLAQALQAEHLESARVGEDRVIPVHEAVQAPVGIDDVRPGTQHKMECVTQDDLGTQDLPAPRASSPSPCRRCPRA